MWGELMWRTLEWLLTICLVGLISTILISPVLERIPFFCEWIIRMGARVVPEKLRKSYCNEQLSEFDVVRQRSELEQLCFAVQSIISSLRCGARQRSTESPESLPEQLPDEFLLVEQQVLTEVVVSLGDVGSVNRLVSLDTDEMAAISVDGSSEAVAEKMTSLGVFFLVGTRNNGGFTLISFSNQVTSEEG